MKALVLCADDFAIHEAASRGIVELAQAGRISATSAMVLSPRWKQDATLLQQLRGQVDVGLHLDWTSPFAHAAGHGLSLGAAMLRSTLGGFNRSQARGVIQRQLDAFEACWQASPDHIDGHQHVQQFTGIREALLDVMAQRYAARQPWLRVSRVIGPRAGLKGAVITALGAGALESAAAQAGIPCAPCLTGIYDFAGDEPRYAGLMDDWLQNARAGAVIMCHPARSAEVGDEIGVARAREFDWLAGAGFARALDNAQVRLSTGTAIYRERG